MIKQTKFRKKRSDRTHIIYELVCNGQSYIGITAKTYPTVNASVISRFKKHTFRARTEDKQWPLYKTMRKFGPDAFEIFILETLRGKAAAHAREVELIREMQPALNLASNK
jgi:hypothetical protein